MKPEGSVMLDSVRQDFLPVVSWLLPWALAMKPVKVFLTICSAASFPAVLCDWLVAWQRCHWPSSSSSTPSQCAGFYDWICAQHTLFWAEIWCSHLAQVRQKCIKMWDLACLNPFAFCPQKKLKFWASLTAAWVIQNIPTICSALPAVIWSPAEKNLYLPLAKVSKA